VGAPAFMRGRSASALRETLLRLIVRFSAGEIPRLNSAGHSSLTADHDKLVGSTSTITAVSGISRFAQNSTHPLSALVRFDRFAAFKRN
jgi:hypothetical protein